MKIILNNDTEFDSIDGFNEAMMSGYCMTCNCVSECDIKCNTAGYEFSGIKYIIIKGENYENIGNVTKINRESKKNCDGLS